MSVNNDVEIWLLFAPFWLLGTFALIGGVSVFGPIGILAGPLIVSFFLAVVRMWDREFDEGPDAPLPGDKRVSGA